MGAFVITKVEETKEGEVRCGETELSLSTMAKQKTVAEKLQAIALLEKENYDYEKVAKTVGVKSQTLRNWVQEGKEWGVQDQIEVKAEKEGITAYDLLEQIKEQVAEGDLGMIDDFRKVQKEALEKLQVLIGKANTVRELRDVTGALKTLGDQIFQMRGGNDKNGSGPVINAENAQINNYLQEQASEMFNRTKQ